MGKEARVYLFGYLTRMIIAGLFLFTFVYLHGFIDGSHLALLTWSLYILCVPGGHGQYLIGAPALFFSRKPIHTELLFWPLAILINLLSFPLRPEIYGKTFFTHFLYVVIKAPNPCWILFGFSALLTFLNFITGHHFFYRRAITYYIIRYILIVISIICLMWLEWERIVFLIHVNNMG